MTHTEKHTASDEVEGRHRAAVDTGGSVTPARGRLARWRRHLPLRVLAAAALIVDAVIHAQLAHRYDLNVASGLSQGDLFRIESGVAALAAVLILLTANRIVWTIVLVIAVSAAAALLLSTYAHIGQIGPIPDMYEPSWYPRKVIAVVAEVVGTVVAIGALASLVIGHRRGN
jgi:hypothetical protein